MASGFYHVGFIVEDIEAAMAEMTNAFGLAWQEPHESSYGDRWRIKVAYSKTGPPFIELIEGEPGGPWDTSGGPRLDHIGFLTDDVEGEAARLVAAGMPVSVGGAEFGRPGFFSYHEAAPLGARVEMVDRAAVQRFFDEAEPPEA